MFDEFLNTPQRVMTWSSRDKHEQNKLFQSRTNAVHLGKNFLKMRKLFLGLCSNYSSTLGTYSYTASISPLKVNNRNRTRYEICSELTKTLERSQWRRSGVFNVNFEHISHPALVFPLLTLNM